MLNPFIELISSVIGIYSFVVFVWVIMSMLRQFNVIKPHNTMINRVFFGLSELVEPALSPLRKLQKRLLPKLYSVDLSPILLILGLHFIRSALYHWFYAI